jgi:hypothetical protein
MFKNQIPRLHILKYMPCPFSANRIVLYKVSMYTEFRQLIVQFWSISIIFIHPTFTVSCTTSVRAIYIGNHSIKQYDGHLVKVINSQKNLGAPRKLGL